MIFASAAAPTTDIDRTIGRLCDEAEQRLAAAQVDLVTVFFTSHFEEEAGPLVRTLVRRYPSAMLVGCSAEGVLGAEAEHERTPAVAIMLAHLPGVRLLGVRGDADRFDSREAAAAWIDTLAGPGAEPPIFFLFGDPFTVPVGPVLELIDRQFPERPVFGGMVSGCDGPGQAVLVLDDQIHRDGIVGVVMRGPIEARAIVSQGCRPIGERFVITRCQSNVIQELGGKPAVRQLHAVLQGLSGEEAALARQSLFIGRAIDERRERFRRGDFLIRHLVGVDPGAGAVVVGDQMRVGASIQFHVRDHVSADEDLREMLAAGRDDLPPAGAFLFSCNGRGTRMWSQPNHDVSVLHEVYGPIPVAGFFAAGELGPVGGRNFIHGHTASIALLRPTT